jgi:hypothetical protein
MMRATTIALLAALVLPMRFANAQVPAEASPLRIDWEKNYLTISGAKIKGREIKVHYLEAYCRDRSTEADWVKHTYIGHETKLIEASPKGDYIKLECRVKDGLEVIHEIRAGADEIDFQILAHNPVSTRSQAHWAQPCIRLDKFTGANQETYLAKSFIFLDGKPQRMPTRDWAVKARYVPGQVWRAKGVDERDVNPRPFSKNIPTSGLIGCYSADEKQIFAVAFEPYQELFQGVAVCLHSDFRLGGLMPGEKKKIRGKMYIVPADMDALVKRYEKEFPEQVERK